MCACVYDEEIIFLDAVEHWPQVGGLVYMCASTMQRILDVGWGSSNVGCAL